MGSTKRGVNRTDLKVKNKASLVFLMENRGHRRLVTVKAAARHLGLTLNSVESYLREMEQDGSAENVRCLTTDGKTAWRLTDEAIVGGAKAAHAVVVQRAIGDE